jgi:hypothetical protein
LVLSKVEGTFRVADNLVNYTFNVHMSARVINVNLNFAKEFTPEEGLIGVAMLAQTIAYNCGFQIDMKDTITREQDIPTDPNSELQ